MCEKSHVSIEQRVCMVCGRPYDTGAILLDKRLRASLKMHTTTGWGLCAEHQRLHEEGFIALVECDPDKGGKPSGGSTIKPDDAYRTGQVAHLKREIFGRIFNIPVDASMPCVFVEAGFIASLQAKIRPR